MVTRPPGGGATNPGVRGEVLVLGLFYLHLQRFLAPRNSPNTPLMVIAVFLFLRKEAEDEQRRLLFAHKLWYWPILPPA